MGRFHPKHRSHEEHYRKRRRNERVLSKFYDAKYVDIRDGEVKKAAALGCNRTNRREPRMSDKNKRIYRGKKVSKGYVSIKKERASIPTGSLVRYKGKTYQTKGMHCNNTRVILDAKTKKQMSVPIQNVKIICRTGGYKKEEMDKTTRNQTISC
jgi:hypothetical protein